MTSQDSATGDKPILGYAIHEMERLNKIIDDLSSNHGIKIVDFEQNDKGINSRTFQLRDENNICYALKIYPLQSLQDNRDRLFHEKQFYMFINEAEINCTPKLLYSNRELRYSILSWIHGKQIKKLKDSDIISIANFINDLNQPYKAKASLPVASDAITDLFTFTASIENRLAAISKYAPSSVLEKSISHWIHESLAPYIREHIRKIETEADELWWIDQEICSFVSPSDVGIHNTLLVEKNLYFFDFEYAGIDDLSKLVADWALQPNHPFSKSQENLLINQIIKKVPERSQGWVNRYYSIKSLCAAKWTLIMLRNYANGAINEQQWVRIKNYAQLYGLE